MTDQIDTRVRPEIRSVLRRLRRRIRRYVLLEGLSLIVALLGVLFWLSLGMDRLYFQFVKLELPVFVRAGFDLVVLGLFVFTFIAWVAQRAFHRFRIKALALVLEKRFPELDDRLITAVELVDSTTGKESDLTASMLSRTVEDVARNVTNLDVGDVFNRRPLWRAVTAAALLAVSVGFLAGTNLQAMEHWFAAYVSLDDEYWDRDYTLEARVLVPPGDTPKTFKDVDGKHVYRHPRGGDLTLSFLVPEGENPRGEAWKIPEDVRISYRSAEQSARGSCTRVGDREFRYSIARLMDSIDVYVTAGDYTNRRPFRIEVVDAPKIDQIVLESFYPEYTGNARESDAGDAIERDPVLVQGIQVSLPLETEFLLRASCNKRLLGARILYDDSEIAFRYATDENGTETGEIEASFSRHADDGSSRNGTTTIPPDRAASFFTQERTQFVVPFVLSAADPQGDSAASARIRELSTEFGPPFIMPPDSPVRIYLEDLDDITSREPVSLTVNAVLDNPPSVQTTLGGIGAAVSEKAMIPVRGIISDDYGIVSAEFGFKINDETEFHAREFGRAPVGRPLEFRLQMSDRDQFERFALRKMGLKVGDRLTLTVFAEDGDNLNGPHRTQGEAYSFRIVDEDELRTLLFQKELNLRERFERIIEEVKIVRDDVQLHRGNHLRGEDLRKTDGAEKELKQIEDGVRGCAANSVFSIRKNLNETAELEQSFRDIREEIVNNHLDEAPQILQRLDDGVITPLASINKNEFPDADRALGAFRLKVDNSENPLKSMDASIADLEILIGRLEDVLNGIQKLETYNELVQQGREIFLQMKKLSEDTEKLKREQILKQLRDLGIEPPKEPAKNDGENGKSDK